MKFQAARGGKKRWGLISSPLFDMKKNHANTIICGKVNLEKCERKWAWFNDQALFVAICPVGFILQVEIYLKVLEKILKIEYNKYTTTRIALF